MTIAGGDRIKLPDIRSVPVLNRTLLAGQITVSADAKDGPSDHVRLTEVSAIGWLLDTSLSYAPLNDSSWIQLYFSFKPGMTLHVNDTIDLHLPGFEVLSEAMHVSSSGVYNHKMSPDSVFPQDQLCVPCVTVETYDGISLANGYYESVCGLQGDELWEGLHSLLRTTHVSLRDDSQLLASIQKVDQSSLKPGFLDLLHAGETVPVSNTSDRAHNWRESSLWQPSFGVGYASFTCEGGCASAKPRLDLHHQFAFVLFYGN